MADMLTITAGDSGSPTSNRLATARPDRCRAEPKRAIRSAAISKKGSD